jgi:hypothetical protein
MEGVNKQNSTGIVHQLKSAYDDLPAKIDRFLDYRPFESDGSPSVATISCATGFALGVPIKLAEISSMTPIGNDLPLALSNFLILIGARALPSNFATVIRPLALLFIVVHLSFLLMGEK